VAFDLLEELNTKLNGRTPTAGELNDLPMLDRVYKESMRVMSSFLWALRVAQNDYQIGQYPIAKGDMVLVSPAIIHHMPELYPEPGRFRPERWLNIEPGPYEFMPFAAGPRMCIGATFAQMEMKLMLAMLLPRFRLSLVAGQMVNRRGVILSYPEGGMPMQLHQQDGRFDKVPVRGNIHKLLDL
jgi:cytochrome P450